MRKTEEKMERQNPNMHKHDNRSVRRRKWKVHGLHPTNVRTEPGEDDDDDDDDDNSVLFMDTHTATF